MTLNLEKLYIIFMYLDFHSVQFYSNIRSMSIMIYFTAPVGVNFTFQPLKDLSTYLQLVNLRKPDTLKNLTCRTFDMIGDIPSWAPFNKLFFINPCKRKHVVALILHVRFFGVPGLIYSPIANKYTGPLYLCARQRANKV